MKNDLYIKSVLTVIAACLVYLCFGKAITPGPAMGQATGVAAENKQIVQTVKVEGVIPVKIAAVERLQNSQTGQWSEWQPLIVAIPK